MDSSDAPTFHKPDYTSSRNSPSDDVDPALPPGSGDVQSTEPDPKAPEPKAAEAPVPAAKRPDPPSSNLSRPTSETLKHDAEKDDEMTPTRSSHSDEQKHLRFADNAEKDDEMTPTPSSRSDEQNHLGFAESAKKVAATATHKLHLHREHARGPSEARQRRQSSVRTVGTVEDIKLPFATQCGLQIKSIANGTFNMFFSFPYWDMAFWSGWSYTWGSILFIIDGIWAWAPLQWPNSEFKGQSEYGVGLLFFIGAILYQVGATMAYLEAVNDGSFAGPAMKRLLEGHPDDQKALLDAKLHMFFGHLVPHHHHHHHDEDDHGASEQDVERQAAMDPCAGWETKDRDATPGSVYPEDKKPASRRGGVDMGPVEEGEFHEYLTWRWWPTWTALRTHHIKEAGYIACSIQLFGATLYGIAGVIALPGILSSLQPWQELAAYWIPETVASVCFLIAGIMFTFITQEKWYRPMPHRIAWWIGVLATAGSIGFLLSAAFGIRSGDYTWCEYQSSLTSTWGSVFYFMSSVLQWYESVNKGPVLAFPNQRVPTLMRL